MPYSLIVFQGPSASGKSTLQALLGLPKVITWTSRPARIGEVHEVDYYFSTSEEMSEMYRRGDFLEMTSYNGNLYGTAFESIRQVFDRSDTQTIIMDVNGAKTLKKLYPDKILLVGVFADKEDCVKRLASRSTGNEIVDRMRTYDEEVGALSHCDVIINNSDGIRNKAEIIIQWIKIGLFQGELQG